MGIGSRKVIEAFKRGTKRTIKNDSTYTDETGSYLFYHGNLIAKVATGKTMPQVTLAGWGTVTTRLRVNEVARRFDAKEGFVQHKGEQYLINRDLRMAAREKANLSPCGINDWVALTHRQRDD